MPCFERSQHSGGIVCVREYYLLCEHIFRRRCSALFCVWFAIRLFICTTRTNPHSLNWFRATFPMIFLPPHEQIRFCEQS